jgi:hypothetical protein
MVTEAWRVGGLVCMPAAPVGLASCADASAWGSCSRVGQASARWGGVGRGWWAGAAGLPWGRAPMGHCGWRGGRLARWVAGWEQLAAPPAAGAAGHHWPRRHPTPWCNSMNCTQRRGCPGAWGVRVDASWLPAGAFSHRTVSLLAGCCPLNHPPGRCDRAAHLASMEIRCKHNLPALRGPWARCLRAAGPGQPRWASRSTVPPRFLPG